jgi:hypothetical protein
MPGKNYSVSVSRAGDATYEPSAEALFEGTTAGAVQSALAMSGWNNNAFPGSTFDIHLTGGSGNGKIDFAPKGCKVEAAAEEGTYTVTVTALEGEAYSLSVTRAGDGTYTPTSMEQSGTARNLEEAAVPTILEPVKTATYSWIYICGGIVLLFGVVLLIMQIANTPRRRRHHR